MIGDKRVVAIIEARMGSTRLPGKVLMPLAGRPALERLIERLRRSRYVDDVVVATTTNPKDEPILALCRELGCTYWRGSEEDVLLRVLEAARHADADIIVETCGDSPLIDHRHVDGLLDLYSEGAYDFVSNSLVPTFPIGFDVKVFATDALAEVERITKDPYDRDNVSPYFYDHPELYKLGQLTAPRTMHRRDLRLTLDYEEDLELLNAVFLKLLPQGSDFTAEDVVALLEREPQLAQINAQYTKDPTKHPGR